MSNNYYLFNTVSADAFIMINKKITRSLGVIPALIIGELLYECKYWTERGECKEGWFFSTIENIERETGIKEKQQASAIKALLDKKLLEKKLMGVPAKRYFRINADGIIALLSEEEPLKVLDIPERVKATLDIFKEKYFEIYGKVYNIKKNDATILDRLNDFDLKIIHKVFINLEDYLQYDNSIKEEHELSIAFLMIPFRRKIIINYFNECLVDVEEEIKVDDDEIEEFIQLSLNEPGFNEFIRKHIHWWSEDRTKTFIRRNDKKSLGYYVEFIKMFKESGNEQNRNNDKNKKARAT